MRRARAIHPISNSHMKELKFKYSFSRFPLTIRRRDGSVSSVSCLNEVSARRQKTPVILPGEWRKQNLHIGGAPDQGKSKLDEDIARQVISEPPWTAEVLVLADPEVLRL